MFNEWSLKISATIIQSFYWCNLCEFYCNFQIASVIITIFHLAVNFTIILITSRQLLHFIPPSHSFRLVHFRSEVTYCENIAYIKSAVNDIMSLTVLNRKCTRSQNKFKIWSEIFSIQARCSRWSDTNWLNENHSKISGHQYERKIITQNLYNAVNLGYKGRGYNEHIYNAHGYQRQQTQKEGSKKRHFPWSQK